MSDETAVLPAMNAAEWEERAFEEADGERHATVVDAQGDPSILSITPLKVLTEGPWTGSYCVGLGGRQRIDIERRHALAALCLYQQPYGFTRSDVELLHDLVPSGSAHLAAPVLAKLAALLPPE